MIETSAGAEAFWGEGEADRLTGEIDSLRNSSAAFALLSLWESMGAEGWSWCASKAEVLTMRTGSSLILAGLHVLLASCIMDEKRLLPMSVDY